MADIGELINKGKLGALTLDEKLSILEHYDIKFDRKEIARELSNIVGQRVRDAKRTDYSKALETATKEEAERAVSKVLDKYVKEAEARFMAERSYKFKEKVVGKTEAKKIKWRWISVLGDLKRCPDCRRRHGQEKTMEEWRAAGLPGQGATVCKQFCRCRLAAIEGPPEDAILKDEGPKPPTGAEVRANLEKKFQKINTYNQRLDFLHRRAVEDMSRYIDDHPDWMKNDEAIKGMQKIADRADRLVARQMKVDKMYRDVFLQEMKAAKPSGTRFDGFFNRKSKRAPWKSAKRVPAKLKKNVEEAFAFVESITESDIYYMHGVKPYDYRTGDIGTADGELRAQVNIFHKGKRASSSGVTLNLATDDGVDVIVHELGHNIELQGRGVREKALAFLKKRGDADPMGPVELFGGKPGPGGIVEKAYKDKFTDIYMGKIYDKERYGFEATEIVSMGIQKLYAAPAYFMQRDPEYFEFIVDILKGY